MAGEVAGRHCREAAGSAGVEQGGGRPGWHGAVSN